MRKKFLSTILIAAMTVASLSGCSSVYKDAAVGALSEEDAKKELKSLMTKVDVTTNDSPILDIYSDEVSEADTLADIDTFPITVQGNGQINLEIAAPSEFSGTAPDNWLNEVAEKFNKSGATADGKSVSVTVRKISSGEVVTYMASGGYKPDIYLYT